MEPVYQRSHHDVTDERSGVEEDDGERAEEAVCAERAGIHGEVDVGNVVSQSFDDITKLAYSKYRG